MLLARQQGLLDSCLHSWCTHNLSETSSCRFADGLKLVKLRGESMQAAADAGKSGMVSVIGLSSDKVLPACKAT